MELRLFVRLFLVQALWNYRTMQGAGLAWVLLPALREVHGDDEEALRSALARTGEHFNAHPYLSGFAAGALARLEAEGAAPEVIRRFRKLLRTPLGSLGDSLVWSGWLPTCVLAAGVLGLALEAPVPAVVVFLAAFNALHLVLRWWGVRAGLDLGRKLGEALRRADLPSWAERVGRGGVFLVGSLAGFVLASGVFVPDPVLSWRGAVLVGALGSLVLTFGWTRGGTPGWWTPVAVLSTVAVLLAAGVVA